MKMKFAFLFLSLVCAQANADTPIQNATKAAVTAPAVAMISQPPVAGLVAPVVVPVVAAAPVVAPAVAARNLFRKFN